MINFLQNIFYTSEAQKRDWALLSSFVADLSPAEFIEAFGTIDHKIFSAMKRLGNGMDRERRERIMAQSLELFEELIALVGDDLKKLNALSQRVRAKDEHAIQQIESVMISCLQRRVPDRNDWVFVVREGMSLFHYYGDDRKSDWFEYALMGGMVLLVTIQLVKFIVENYSGR